MPLSPKNKNLQLQNFHSNYWGKSNWKVYVASSGNNQKVVTNLSMPVCKINSYTYTTTRTEQAINRKENNQRSMKQTKTNTDYGIHSTVLISHIKFHTKQKINFQVNLTIISNFSCTICEIKVVPRVRDAHFFSFQNHPNRAAINLYRSVMVSFLSKLPIVGLILVSTFQNHQNWTDHNILIKVKYIFNFFSQRNSPMISISR